MLYSLSELGELEFSYSSICWNNVIITLFAMGFVHAASNITHICQQGPSERGREDVGPHERPGPHHHRGSRAWGQRHQATFGSQVVEEGGHGNFSFIFCRVQHILKPRNH